MKQPNICVQLLLLASMISAVLLSQSCHNPIATTGPGVQEPFELITIALPYVEAVHFPNEIHAGQPFQIELDLSCVQNPNALRTPAHPFQGDVIYYTRFAGGETQEDYFVGLNVYRDMAGYDASSPIISTINFSVKGLSVGQHELAFNSARNQAEGGQEVIMNKYDGYWRNVEKTEEYLHKFIITVLP